MECQFTFRVRYAETDQMGTFYNARALEWFEVGRSELARAMGLPYAEWERRGVFLPLVETHLKFTGRAVYDDLLQQSVTVEPMGHVRLEFRNQIVQAANGQPVCVGWTRHALVNASGRPVRMPDWLRALMPPASPPVADAS